MKDKISSLLAQAKKEAGLWQLILWYIVRVLLLAGIFFSQGKLCKLFVAAALLFTFCVSLIRLFSKKTDEGLSFRLQTLICISAFFGAFVGKAVNVLELFPEYDIFLHLLAGVIGVLAGYYIALAFNKPRTANEMSFTAIVAFAISCWTIYVREIAEFFIDYFTGTNITNVRFVGETQWLFELFGYGPASEILNQRRIMDTNEDMLLAVLSTFITTVILMIYLRVRHKKLYGGASLKISFKPAAFPAYIKRKLSAEKEKINSDCSIGDLLVWWCVRAVMVYAAFNMPNMAEAVLLSVNLLGTFAISLLHILTPMGSFPNRLSYRIQTVVTLVVFLGSYCGNYVFLYGMFSNFSLVLHAGSGFFCVVAGYYVSRALLELRDKRQHQLSAIFSLCATGIVVPIHEAIEFVGDLIWVTQNQSYSWGIPENSLFYKIFGQGVNSWEMMPLLDTVLDMLLATFTAFIAFTILYISLMKRAKKLSTVQSNTPQTQEIETKVPVRC